jgi:hypothetical protein
VAHPSARRPIVTAVERISRVQIVTASEGTVEISWDARERLLQELRGLEGGEDAVHRFEAAGTSRPVELDGAGKVLLLRAVLDWMATVRYDQLPDGIRKLRDGLEKDLEDGPIPRAPET